jgi:hypothetical protein
MKTKDELIKERDSIVEVIKKLKKNECKDSEYTHYYFIENLMERLKQIDKLLDEK